MLDHVSLGTADFERAKTFYDAVLAPLGYRRLMEFGQAAGYGERHPGFWIGAPLDAGRPVAASAGTHIAFVAPNRAAVDAFHAAALAAGGRDDGRPGLRPHYHADYYAAFVFDLDGHKIEAVCHRPE